MRISFNLAAMSSMRMTAIQTKAVRKSRRRIMVRGSTRACMEVGLFFKKNIVGKPRDATFLLSFLPAPLPATAAAAGRRLVIRGSPGRARLGTERGSDRGKLKFEFRYVCTHLYIFLRERTFFVFS